MKHSKKIIFLSVLIVLLLLSAGYVIYRIQSSQSDLESINIIKEDLVGFNASVGFTEDGTDHTLTMINLSDKLADNVIAFVNEVKNLSKTEKFSIEIPNKFLLVNIETKKGTKQFLFSIDQNFQTIKINDKYLTINDKIKKQLSVLFDK